MKCIRKITFVSILFLVFFVNCCFAANSEIVTCTGKVVNIEGKPVESAKIGFYKILVSPGEVLYQVSLDKEGQTDKEGKFAYETEKGSSNTQVVIIYVQKEGFGLGWANWEMRNSENFEIKLYPAAAVSGVVVDESDKPVADANVSLAFLMIKTGDQPQFLLAEMMPDKLTTKTDGQGKFAFDNIPENARFDFRVKKPGRAATCTMDMQKFQSSQTLSFAAGQTDIKIVQPPEASIKGIVIEKDTGKPLSGVRIVLGQDSEISFMYGFKPVISGQDGTFSINGLPAMKFNLTPVALGDKASEWVSKPVEVTTEVGKTTSGVKIELGKGELLEVLVKDAKDKKPIEQATVLIQPQEGGKTENARTNKDGIAQFHLAPGTYRIVQIYKQDYKQIRTEELVVIEDGKTKRMDFSLESPGKITGIVRDENDKPVAGATVHMNPPAASQTKTDSSGKFVMSDQNSGFSDEGVPYLIVRDKENNLAVSYELYDKKENLEIKLSKGITLSGKVVDPNNNGIPNPKIQLIIWTSDTGFGNNEPVAVDEQGNFQIKALPGGVRYSVSVQADGYGRDSSSIQTSIELGEIFELEPIILKLANMSVSGIVVDIDGKPAGDAEVYSSGSGQPNQRAKTDNEGRFTLEKVCAGNIRIQANKTQGTHLYGYIQTLSGAKDVQIVISESGSSRTVQPQPVSLKGKPLPDMNNLLDEFKPEAIQGKSVLVCFWDYEQRPSRNCIMQLNQKLQELESKDVTAITIQAAKIDSETLDQWIKENNISLSVGKVANDEERTRLNWGVNALPWLILTDKEHKVIAEGFSINELDEKIKLIK
ncbi:MAG: carboxypeptidase regulatory-like domain-containing protein [Sedimentisphaerales bacterium]|nr:carboxypeptidase regulatory-like domain-containing protein [Sedimentisphaerales bacterium]